MVQEFCPNCSAVKRIRVSPALFINCKTTRAVHLLAQKISDVIPSLGLALPTAVFVIMETFDKSRRAIKIDVFDGHIAHVRKLIQRLLISSAASEYNSIQHG